MKEEDFFERIRGLWPVAKGCVAEVRKPCIRPGCQACKRGEKHPATIFAFERSGKKRCMYVPKEMESTLRQAVHNGRELESLMVEMGAELIEDYRKNRPNRLRKERGKR